MRPAGEPPARAEYEDVKSDIRGQLLTIKRERAFEAWLDRQRKAARIDALPLRITESS